MHLVAIAIAGSFIFLIFFYFLYEFVFFFLVKNFKVAMIIGFLPTLILWLIFLFKDDFLQFEFVLVPTIVSLSLGLIRYSKKEKKSISEIDKMKIDDL
jgi:uncharacterized membrane-anchored protein